MLKKTLLCAAMAASLLSLGTAANAQVTVTFGPPAPVHEVVPAPRSGYVWVPGYYNYRGGDYTWVRGHWVAERPGYAFVAPRWEQRGERWVMVGNTWERRGPGGDRDRDGIANRYDRDRDGDGIPNRYDNRPNRSNDRYAMGPRGDLDRDGVQNRHDRDIDGDGVRNARDRFPYNHRRS